MRCDWCTDDLADGNPCSMCREEYGVAAPSRRSLATKPHRSKQLRNLPANLGRPLPAAQGRQEPWAHGEGRDHTGGDQRGISRLGRAGAVARGAGLSPAARDVHQIDCLRVYDFLRRFEAVAAGPVPSIVDHVVLAGCFGDGAQPRTDIDDADVDVAWAGLHDGEKHHWH